MTDPIITPQFQHLYGALKDISQAHGQYAYTTTASILLIMGWLLTSEQAHKALSRQSKMEYWIVGTLATIFTIEVGLSWAFYKSSSRIVGYIQTFKPPVPEEFYAHNVVTPVLAYTILVGHLVLYIILYVIVHNAGKQDVSIPPKKK